MPVVVTQRDPPVRSPSPPNRVLRSTHGGNLFTEEDIKYLQRYIDYCQTHGLTLRSVFLTSRLANSERMVQSTRDMRKSSNKGERLTTLTDPRQ